MISIHTISLLETISGRNYSQLTTSSCSHALLEVEMSDTSRICGKRAPWLNMHMQSSELLKWMGTSSFFLRILRVEWSGEGHRVCIFSPQLKS